MFFIIHFKFYTYSIRGLVQTIIIDEYYCRTTVREFIVWIPSLALWIFYIPPNAHNIIIPAHSRNTRKLYLCSKTHTHTRNRLLAYYWSSSADFYYYITQSVLSSQWEKVKFDGETCWRGHLVVWWNLGSMTFNNNNNMRLLKPYFYTGDDPQLAIIKYLYHHHRRHISTH